MKKLSINFCGWGQNWHLGTLAHHGRTLLFEYSDVALQKGVELSPIYLKLRKVAYSDFPDTQDNLPGLIADALPDGWGRLLMDRCFQKNGRDPAGMSPLDRLAFIHDRAMGALVFAPPDALSRDPEYQELRVLAEGAQAVLAGQDTATLEQLALTGGSPHGARPKVLVQYNAATGQVSTDRAAPGAPWLVKFQAQGEAREVCAIEMLYASMARKCELDAYSTQTGHLFRRKLDSRSSANWTPVPDQTGHHRRDGAGLRCGFTPDGVNLSNWPAFSAVNLLSN